MSFHNYNSFFLSHFLFTFTYTKQLNKSSHFPISFSPFTFFPYTFFRQPNILLKSIYPYVFLGKNNFIIEKWYLNNHFVATFSLILRFCFSFSFYCFNFRANIYFYLFIFGCPISCSWIVVQTTYIFIIVTFILEKWYLNIHF